MAVIGIDPGTALTGYGIIEELPDQSLQVIDFGVIRTDPTDKPEIRLRKIFSQLNEILALYKLETGAVEKLLVDAYSDLEFEFVHGMEIEHIFNNAFSIPF